MTRASVDSERLDRIVAVIDEELLKKNKAYLTLAQANKVLINEGVLEVFEQHSGFLKELLENGFLPQAYKTNNRPRQWRILLSHPRPKKIVARKNAEPEHTSEKHSNSSTILFFSILGILCALVYFINTNPNAKTERNYSVANTETDYDDTRVESSANEREDVFEFISTLYDIEQNGRTIQTFEEVTYHTLDLSKKLVIMEARNSEGSWKKFTFPIKYHYQDGVTHVFEIKEYGVKEFWYSPTMNNLGYDFVDGQRHAYYNLSTSN